MCVFRKKKLIKLINNKTNITVNLNEDSILFVCNSPDAFLVVTNTKVFESLDGSFIPNLDTNKFIRFDAFGCKTKKQSYLISEIWINSDALVKLKFGIKNFNEDVSYMAFNKDESIHAWIKGDVLLNLARDFIVLDDIKTAIEYKETCLKINHYYYPNVTVFSSDYNYQLIKDRIKNRYQIQSETDEVVSEVDDSTTDEVVKTKRKKRFHVSNKNKNQNGIAHTRNRTYANGRGARRR